MMRIEFQDFDVIKKTAHGSLIPVPQSNNSFWLPNSLIYNFAPIWLRGYIPDDKTFKIYDAKTREEISKTYLDTHFNSGRAPYAPHGLYANYYYGN